MSWLRHRTCLQVTMVLLLTNNQSNPFWYHFFLFLLSETATHTALYVEQLLQDNKNLKKQLLEANQQKEEQKIAADALRQMNMHLQQQLTNATTRTSTSMIGPKTPDQDPLRHSAFLAVSSPNRGEVYCCFFLLLTLPLPPPASPPSVTPFIHRSFGWGGRNACNVFLAFAACNRQCFDGQRTGDIFA